MKRCIKRWTSVILVLFLVSGQISTGINGISTENTENNNSRSVQINDQFSMMYDSDKVFLEKVKPFLEKTVLEDKEQKNIEQVETVDGKSEAESADLSVQFEEKIEEKAKEALQGIKTGELAMDASLADTDRQSIQKLYDDSRVDRFIVKYKDGGKLTSNKISGQNNQTVLNEKNHLVSVKLNKKVNPAEYADQLRATRIAEEIEYIQPDFLLDSSGIKMEVTEIEEENKTGEIDTQDKPSEADPQIQPETMAPEMENTFKDIIVALIDTGVDINHSMLNGLLVDGWDFVENDGDVYDESQPFMSAHGTHIAGIIVQNGNEHVKVMPLKVFGDNGAYTSNIIAAINYAEANGAKVANCSFGSKSMNFALKETMENSTLLFVAAAGNERQDIGMSPVYPAAFGLSNLISVASLNVDGGFSFYSNYSSNIVDIGAQGRDVNSALPDGAYGLMSGTSMAAGQVSAAAGLVLAENTTLTPEELKTRLCETGDRLLNLANKVIDGRRLNTDQALSDEVQENWIDVNPADDFDVQGYQRTPEENWALFTGTGQQIKKVAGGESHTLVLLEDGTVWAWGWNSFGQLGTGMTSTYETLVQVVGLTNIEDIAAGPKCSFAVSENGALWAWGQNNYGQLGIGSTTNRSIPTAVNNISTIKAISAGEWHTLGVTTSGGVYSWGEDGSGQLGTGSAGGSSSTPIEISLWGIKNVAAGSSHSIAVNTGGTVYVWGTNTSGSLGMSGSYRYNPTQNPNLSNVSDIATGSNHCLALLSDGTVKSWGDGNYSPVLVYGLANVAGISTSTSFSMVRKNDGTVMTWGYNNYGQLGINSQVDSFTPVQVNGLTGSIGIAAGSSFGFSVKSDYTLWAWGSNSYHQLGDGTTTNRLVPVQSQTGFLSPTPAFTVAFTQQSYTAAILPVAQTKVFVTAGVQLNGETIKGASVEYGLSQAYTGVSIDSSKGIITILPTAAEGTVTVTASFRDATANVNLLLSHQGMPVMQAKKAVAGSGYTLVLLEDGTVWGWGRVPGISSSSSSSKILVQVPGLTNVNDIEVGSCICAIKQDGTLWGWGENSYGQLGDGSTTFRELPIQIAGITNVKSVSVGPTHILAIKEDGTLWAWGNNANGKLGDGTCTDRTTPVQVTALSNVISAAAGGVHSLAATSGGAVYSWGLFDGGQLGFYEGGSSYYTVPHGVNTLAAMVAAGPSHSMALWPDGKVYAWGNNNNGLLGDGTHVTVRVTPVQVVGLTGVIKISTTADRTCAVKSDGTVWSWGGSYSAVTPVQVPNLAGILDVSVGVSHSIALRDDGSLWAWGQNSYGQLGNGGTSASSVPVASYPEVFYTPVPTTITLSKSSYTAVCLPDRTTNVQITGTQVLDNHGMPMQGVEVAYSLVQPFTGVSVNSTTGEVTISSAASAGTAAIRVTCGGASNTINIVILDGEALRKQIEKVAQGDGFSLALLQNGTVWGWGVNDKGQLGCGHTSASEGLVQISGLTNITDIAAGGSHSLAIKADGSLWSWGANNYGQLGDGSTVNRTSPVRISGISQVKAIAAGLGHSLAVRQDGTVWAWGLNSSKQLGNGGTSNVTTPAQVGYGLLNVKSVSAGSEHSLAVKENGTIWSWGKSTGGRLGKVSGEEIPSQIPNLSGVAEAGAGYSHSIALLSNGTVMHWGYTSSGTTQYTPTQANGLSNITKISAGNGYSVALRSDGTVKIWGYTNTERYSFNVKQVPVITNVKNIAAGDDTILAATEEDALWSWTSDAPSLCYPEFFTGMQQAAGIQFSKGYEIANILSIGTTAIQVEAKALDETGAAIEGMPISYSLAQPHAGVTLDTQAGAITISPSTSAGTITVHAAYGTFSDDITVFLVTSPLLGERVKKISAGSEDTLILLEDGTVWHWGINFGQAATGAQIPGLTDVKDIDAGSLHYLALKQDGTVWAWGNNYYGQLGDGTKTNRQTPVRVLGLTQVKSIDVGSGYSMVLKEDGTVWTWGCNSEGELGDGTTYNRTYPVQVCTNIISISAGPSHCLALTTGGSVLSWGSNVGGQLGNGSVSTYPQTTPDYVGNLTGVTGIAAGSWHSIALKEDGTVWGWGDNEYGVLGFTQFTTYTSPVQVQGVSGAADVAVGQYHSFALKPDGTVWSWGYNSKGQIGIDSVGTSNNPPRPIPGLTGITSIASGMEYGFAVKSNYTVWAWGDNSSGQLGDGTITQRQTPVQIQSAYLNGNARIPDNLTFDQQNYLILVPQSQEVMSISAGAVDQNNVQIIGLPIVYMLAQPYDGISINNVTGEITVSPSVEPGLVQVVAIYKNLTARANLVIQTDLESQVPVSIDFTADEYVANLSETGSTAITVQALVFDWESEIIVSLHPTYTIDSYSGVSINATTGVVTITSAALPGRVTVRATYEGLSTSNEIFIQLNQTKNAVQTAAGLSFSVALDDEGHVWTWGSNQYGQLGLGNNLLTSGAHQVPGLENVVQIAAGQDHVLILKSDGTVWVWGRNSRGSLGIGSDDPAYSPIQVSGLSNVVYISAGIHTGAAVKSDGTVWVWGWNGDGQLGNGTTTDCMTPVQISGLSNITKVVLGDYHCIALQSNGNIWIWGSNESGQLGNGTTTASSTPVQTSINNAVDVAAGYQCSFVVKNDGTLWAWGRNYEGQLGDGTNIERHEPVQVNGLSGAVKVYASSQVIAQKNDGTIWSWGINGHGQIGDGTTTNRNTPVQLSGFTATGISVGPLHSLAVKEDGTVWGWGQNGNGQLGIGTSPYSLTPAQCQEEIFQGPPQVLDSIDFIAPQTYIVIPASGRKTVTFKAEAYDETDRIIRGAVVSYSLANTYPGIAINSATGVLTITSSAQVGTITVIASYGGMEGSVDIVLQGSSTVASSIAFTAPSYSAIVPVSGQINVTVQAGAYDENGQLIEGAGIVYSLAGTYTGVTINSTTGVVTIDPSAALGPVSISAAFGGASAEVSLVLQDPDDAVSEIEFAQAGYVAYVPQTGEATLNVQALALGQDHRVIQGLAVNYSLAASYAGVSIDSSTGVVTVDSTALPGQVQIVASYQQFSAIVTLTLSSGAGMDLLLQVTQGNTYLVSATFESMSDGDVNTFILTYDDSVLELTDLCALTSEKELESGTVGNTGISIISVEPGEIVFSVDKDIPQDMVWTGILNIFQFSALSSAQTSVNLK